MPVPPKKAIYFASTRREKVKSPPPANLMSAKVEPQIRLPVFLSPRNSLLIVSYPDPAPNVTAQTSAPAGMPVARSSHPFGKVSTRILTPPERALVAASVPAERHADAARFKRLGRELDPRISIAGAPPAAADLLDGPISTGGIDRPRPTTGFNEKRKQAQSVLDVVPGDNKVDLFADPKPNDFTSRARPLHPNIFDVSEGTRLDPLKNKNYDLNSAKDIPTEFSRNN